MIYMTAPEISKRLEKIYKSFSGTSDIFTFRLLEHSKVKIAFLSANDIEKVRAAIELASYMLDTKYLLDNLFYIMDWNVLCLVNMAITDSIAQLKNGTLECDVPEEDEDFFRIYSCFSLDSLRSS